MTTAETLAAHEKTLYKLTRQATRTDLRFERLFAHFGIEDVTDTDVDEALDSQ